MNLENRLIIILVLLAFAATVGLIWKSQSGRTHRVRSGEQVDLKRLSAEKAGKPVVKFGKKATLLQFSTEMCSVCVQTSRVLGELEKQTPGLVHIEVDVTNRLDLASHFKVLQTPTTLILDNTGRVISRISGAPKPTQLNQLLENLNG